MQTIHFWEILTKRKVLFRIDLTKNIKLTPYARKKEKRISTFTGQNLNMRRS